MKQTIKFGKVRLARYSAIRVESYEHTNAKPPRVRAGVALVKSQ